MAYQPIFIKKGGADSLAWYYRGNHLQKWSPFPNAAAQDFEAMKKYLSDNYGDNPQISFSDDSGAPVNFVEVSKSKYDRLRIRINAGERFADLLDFNIFPYADQLRFFQERADDETILKITTADESEAVRAHRLAASEKTRAEFKAELEKRLNDKNNITEILKKHEGQDAKIFFTE
jgi:hypothetical protein